ncbi:MAG: magnesium and cobalt transporter [Zhongshania aliphaticivorans]|jgi:magnesium and cobalt transporter|uniref:Magnesium and cobalt efflux protein CorC n=2 Tax=Zhongshania aliphaticivorans TaxID=1470434 RepID=A0A127M8I2_9GAMM|nr:transporter associated domain-containing protein [Zhongshania aliphaticivorans]AMO69522.1 magnesium/cobalt efflux protein [Zhongshania aliphaticivorans]EIF42169.1 transporter-associated protein [gamma proteobacterium BDW918]|tara:strand:+ start:11891 stop:12748 length:858 start_codon:yes stop_codon:yes gene_type:complete
MSEDRSSNDPSDKSWIEKIAHAFSSEPKTREDLFELLAVAKQNEVIDDDAISIVEGAMHISDMQAREIMIPRPQMVVLKADQPLSELLPIIVDTGHSRYPVIGDTLDNVLGILLSKDLLPLLWKTPNSEDIDIRDILRPATLVPESKRLNVLLRDFREKRHHMAVVIDEYGGAAGLITIEDILEQIVGDIEDEYDEDDDLPIRKITDNDFVVQALTPIDDFNDYFNAKLSDEEFDTIGGLLLKSFGYLPSRNEVARLDDFEFKVVNADNRQIHLLRMRSLAKIDD